MLSYQWDVQETIKRVKDELQTRGYVVWLGKPNADLRPRTIVWTQSRAKRFLQISKGCRGP